MSLKTPGCSPYLSTSAAGSQAPDGSNPARNDDEPESQEPTEIFVLSNSVVIARPDHTSIQAVHGTDYGEPLPAETRRRLRWVAEVAPDG